MSVRHIPYDVFVRSVSEFFECEPDELYEQMSMSDMSELVETGSVRWIVSDEHKYEVSLRVLKIVE